MRALLLLLSFVAGIGTAAETYAAPAAYTLDPTHTRIAFRANHAGFSRALGTFTGATGTLHLDEDDWTSARLELMLPIATLDLGDPDWNRKILDGTFFDADKLPHARFVSTAVEKRDENTLHVKGELTIHGITQPVEFDATINAIKRHPLTFRRTAGFSATLVVSRKAFGIDAWASVVDDAVEILVELEATRARTDDKAASPAEPANDADADAPEPMDAPEKPEADDAAAA
jgi:polyisoprenoid-binding protein YceI